MTEREEVIAELRKELEWDEDGDPTFEELKDWSPYFREIFDKLIDSRLQSGWKEYPKEKPTAEGFYWITSIDNAVDKAYFHGGDNEKWWARVIAWQPLPSPFRKEG